MILYKITWIMHILGNHVEKSTIVKYWTKKKAKIIFDKERFMKWKVLTKTGSEQRRLA